MIFNLAMYMQGGVNLAYLESVTVNKVRKLYNQSLKHSKEQERLYKK